VIWRLASWLAFLSVSANFEIGKQTSPIHRLHNTTFRYYSLDPMMPWWGGGSMKNGVRFNHVGPQFAVEDVEKAVGFYAAVLGFALDYLDGEPPHYAVVFRDEVYIHLSQSQQPDLKPGGGRAFVVVSGIDVVWERARSEAPNSITQPLETLDYGHEVRFRGFALSDPAGNTLRIGEPLTIDPIREELFPSDDATSRHGCG
jgi:catechol 2,3-dioxygenase-like lactoylglutathione lyase family enzyme